MGAWAGGWVGGVVVGEPYVFQADVVFGMLGVGYGVLVGMWVVEMVWGMKAK